MSATTSTGIQYATGGDPAEIHTVSANLASTVNPLVTGSAADETARNAMYAVAVSAGKTGMRCYVRNKLDWCGWNGSEWIYDHPTPIFYQTAAVGPSHSAGTGFTNTAAVYWGPADASFTTSRAGFVIASFDYDVATGSPGGWGAASTTVNLDGNYIADGIATIANEQVGGGGVDGSRRTDRYACRVPIWVTAGVHPIRVGCWQAGGGTGSWRFVSFAWKITLL